jgi:hypothetical protein
MTTRWKPVLNMSMCFNGNYNRAIPSETGWGGANRFHLFIGHTASTNMNHMDQEVRNA